MLTKRIEKLDIETDIRHFDLDRLTLKRLDKINALNESSL